MSIMAFYPVAPGGNTNSAEFFLEDSDSSGDYIQMVSPGTTSFESRSTTATDNQTIPT
jgi:hypothetical protein